MAREFITSDQWIAVETDGADPGVRYYDGVHHGFVLAHDLTRIGPATDAELAAARRKALECLRARRQHRRHR